MHESINDLLIWAAITAAVSAAFIGIMRWSDPDTPESRRACEIIQIKHPGNYC